MVAFQEESDISGQHFCLENCFFVLFFFKPIRKLREKGNNLVQENIERKNFKLFHKVTLGFVCTFCAM